MIDLSQFTLEQAKQNEFILIETLTDSGANFKGNKCNCPFHDDQHPSAGIYRNEAQQFCFKCQTCGVQGSIIDIIAKVENVPAADVLKRLKKSNGASQRSQPKELTPKVFESMEALKSSMPFPIENTHPYTDPATGEVDLIVFRLKTPEGKTYRQCSPVPGGWIQKKPKGLLPLYNRHRVMAADTVVIGEGERVVEAFQKQGITATTSSGGAGKAHLTDARLLVGKNIILWPDSDKIGADHMDDWEAILQKLEPAPRISRIEPADLDLSGKEDVVDFIEQLKASGCNDISAGLNEALDKAKIKGIAAGVGDLIEDIIAGRRIAVKWPWVRLGGLTKALVPGTTTLLCGNVGASKSFLVLQAVVFWFLAGIKFALYELEENRTYHLRRCLAQITSTSSLTDEDWIKDNPETARKLYADNTEFLDSFGVCIHASPETQPTLTQVAQWIEDRAKVGCRVIAVDPITAADTGGQKTWEADKVFLNSIAKTADIYQCSIVLVTHPIKVVSFPDVTQLQGGAAYQRACQTILWLESHNEKTGQVKASCGTIDQDYNRTLHILKARNGKGQGARLAYNFTGDTLKLSELGIIVREKKN